MTLIFLHTSSKVFSSNNVDKGLFGESAKQKRSLRFSGESRPRLSFWNLSQRGSREYLLLG